MPTMPEVIGQLMFWHRSRITARKSRATRWREALRIEKAHLADVAIAPLPLYTLISPIPSAVIRGARRLWLSGKTHPTCNTDTHAPAKIIDSHSLATVAPNSFTDTVDKWSLHH